MNKFIVSENSYGHKKRFDFIKKQISEYCLNNNLNKYDIKILDVGCGSGTLVTLPLGELGYNILGIDLDETSIEFAKVQNIFRNINFETKTVENINNQYDIILTCEILEHLDNPVQFLNTTSSKLKPEGIIILTTPNGYGWSEREAKIINTLYKNKWLKMAFNRVKGHAQAITMNKDDKHLQKFNYELLIDLFNKAGLKAITLKSGPVFGGPIVERTWARMPGFKTISNWLGDILPKKMALVWYFVLKNN